jgi:hypothetical protein
MQGFSATRYWRVDSSNECPCLPWNLGQTFMLLTKLNGGLQWPSISRAVTMLAKARFASAPAENENNG